MPVSDEKLDLLCVEFSKPNCTDALKALEMLFIYGLNQLLQYYSPLHFKPVHTLQESAFVGNQAKTTLSGKLLPVLEDTGLLQKIEIQFLLKTTSTQQTLLNLHYVFSNFNESSPTLEKFTPAWDELSVMMQWLACQLVGTLCAQQALYYWQKLQAHCIFSKLHELQAFRNACLNMDDFTQSQATFLFLIDKNPTLFLAQLELGQLYKRHKLYAEAIEVLQAAWKNMVDVVPKERALCATEIGVCFALMGRKEEACHWWKVAIHEDETLVNPYLNLAYELENANNLAEAEHYFKQVTCIAPEDKRAFYNLARLYSKMELWEKAIYQYEHQLCLEPNNAWTYCNIANCYLQVEGIEKAKTLLEKTLSLDPHGEAGRFANFILAGLQAAEV